MVLLAPAFAEELPWACPEVDEPADAQALQTDGGLEEVYGAVGAEARTWWDEDCDWTVWEWEKKEIRLEECVTSAGAELRRYTQEEEVGDRGSRSLAEASVVLPEGLASWTSISWQVEDYAHDSAYGGGSYSQDVAWTGSVEGVPDDGWLSLFSGHRGDDGTDITAYSTPGCGWAYGYDGESRFTTWSTRTATAGTRWTVTTTAPVPGIRRPTATTPIPRCTRAPTRSPTTGATRTVTALT